MNKFIIKSLASASLSLMVMSGCGKSKSHTEQKVQEVIPSEKQVPALTDSTTDAQKEAEALLKNFSTYEQKFLQAAIEKAKSNGKLLIVDVTAAWCGPCQKFKKVLEEQKSEVGEILNQFDVVMLEEQYYQLGNITEFIPYKTPFYPSILFFNPQSGQWSTATFDKTASELTSVLQAFSKNGSLLNWHIESIKSGLETGKETSFYPLYSLPQVLTLESEKIEDAVLKLEEILALLDAKEELVLKASGSESLQALKDELLTDLQSSFLSSGKLTLERYLAANKSKILELGKTDPGYAVYTSYSGVFLGTMSAIYRAGGLGAAIEKCDSISELVKSEFKFSELPVPEGASEDEKKKIESTNQDFARRLKQYEFAREGTCLLFKSHGKIANEEQVLSFIAKFDIENPPVVNTNPSTNMLVQLAASTSSDAGFAKAKELDAIYIKKSDLEDEEYLKSLEEKLLAAKAANDLEKIKSIEASIASVQATRQAMLKAHEVLAETFSKKLAHPYAMVP